MPELFAPGLPEQVAEVRRELAQRRRVYPRLVSDGRLAEDKAHRQIEVMEAVLATLEGLRPPPPPL